MGSGVGDFGWRACRGPRAGVLKDLGLAAEVEAEGAIGRVWLLPAGYRRRTGGAMGAATTGCCYELSSAIEGTGQKRGWQPGSKASTMIIRPPQQGQAFQSSSSRPFSA